MSTAVVAETARGLVVKDLHAYYGQSHVLQGITVSLQQGEVVALLGRNGAGKTTTFRAIAGLMERTTGTIQLNDKNVLGKKPYEISRSGIVYVPSGRRSFPQMTVRENLQVAQDGKIHRGKTGKADALIRVFDMFPVLKSRMGTPAGVLSGGENQMLKMACAFLANPSILLLDEPTEGLAPIVVNELRGHIRTLASTGVGIFIAEQNAHFAFDLCRRGYVLNKGSLQMAGTTEALAEDALLTDYLGI